MTRAIRAWAIRMGKKKSGEQLTQRISHSAKRRECSISATAFPVQLLYRFLHFNYANVAKTTILQHMTLTEFLRSFFLTHYKLELFGIQSQVAIYFVRSCRPKRTGSAQFKRKGPRARAYIFSLYIPPNSRALADSSGITERF